MWASAHRQKGRYQDADRTYCTGPFTQVSRLGNPLFNEVIVPMSKKDRWNKVEPRQDYAVRQVRCPARIGQAAAGARIPGVFPNLAKLTKDRADLLAILLTGIPAGLIPGFQNYTGPKQGDMLRLNVAIPPSREAD